MSERENLGAGIFGALSALLVVGATRPARCNSGFFQGVEWLEDTVVEGR